MSQNDLIEKIWRSLRKEINDLSDQRDEDWSQSLHAGESSSFPIYLVATAPKAADGMTDYATAFISDGRKSGEGAGAGTGVPCYYDPSSDKWLTFSSDTEVLS